MPPEAAPGEEYRPVTFSPGRVMVDSNASGTTGASSMISSSSRPHCSLAASRSLIARISSILALMPSSLICARLELPWSVMLRPSNSGGRKVEAEEAQSGHQPVIAASFWRAGVPIVS